MSNASKADDRYAIRAMRAWYKEFMPERMRFHFWGMTSERDRDRWRKVACAARRE